MKPISILFAACLVLAGCATATMNTGRDFDTSNVSKIVKGETTVAQVQAWLGAPYSKSTISDGTEKFVWMYTNIKSHATSYLLKMDVKTETTGKRLSIDAKNGIVQDFSFTEGPINPYGV